MDKSKATPEPVKEATKETGATPEPVKSETVIFPYAVKYNGKYYPPNTEIKK